MKTILHTADSRGHANYGWLNTHYTFSFANYHNPNRIHFGALRVLNDDIIEAGMGFGTHPHDNMEIITIPLEGDLEHKDSMGNTAVIHHGEVQVMSAGTGITHSEYNKNNDQKVKLLQIWVFPNKRNVQPRYDQVSIKDIRKDNDLFQILSPVQDDQGVWIHQEAWFHLGQLKKGWEGKYTLRGDHHGVYVFIIQGNAEVGGQKLAHRDGMGLWETNELEISIIEDTYILLMEVPMLEM